MLETIFDDFLIDLFSDEVAQIQSLIHDLSEVTSAVEGILDVIKYQKDNEIDTNTDEKRAVELSDKELWDDFSLLKTFLNNQTYSLEGSIEVLSEDIFFIYIIIYY